MKRCLLAATCIAAFIGSAHANTGREANLSCGIGTVDYGNPATGGNAVVRTDVQYNGQFWSVVHTLASGQMVDRALQYDIQDRTDTGHLQWAGVLRGKPNIWMVGEIMRGNADGRPYYDEWLYDGNKGNTVIFHSVTACTPIYARAPAPPIAQPSAPTYTPPPAIDQPSAPTLAPAPAPAPAPTTGTNIVEYGCSPGKQSFDEWKACHNGGASAASAGASFSVPIYKDPFGTTELDVTIGSASYNTSVRMTLDTGATFMSVSSSLANTLVANGEATWMDDNGGTVTLADGTSHPVKRVLVKVVTLAGHAIYNVPATVDENDTAGMLFGMQALARFGKFTIDPQNNQLRFS
jgi:hypothetical protein